MTETAPIRTMWIVAPVAIVMALFIVLLATRDAGDRGFQGTDLDGRLAPTLVGETLDGDRFDLDDYRGQFVVVNFFQTTCIPCIQEHPQLVSFQETYASSGFATIVSVAFDDSASNIRSFFEEFGGDWPVVASDTGSIAVDYGVPQVPESVVVAPTGEVIRKLIGGVRQGDLEAVIQGWLEANA